MNRPEQMRRQARRLSRYGFQPTMMFTANDQLPETPAVFIFRWAWRYRSELGPMFIATVTMAAAAVLHAVHHDGWLTFISAATASATTHLVGHSSTAVTAAVYRHQLRPVITKGTETLNTVLNQHNQAKSARCTGSHRPSQDREGVTGLPPKPLLTWLNFCVRLADQPGAIFRSMKSPGTGQEQRSARR